MEDHDEFKEHAKDWDNDPDIVLCSLNTFNHFNNIIKPLDTKIMKCIEIGAGTGLLTSRISPLFLSIEAVDTSSAMTSKLIDKHLPNVVTSTIMSTTANIIVTAMTMHHISDVNSFSKDMYNHLTENGSIVIYDLLYTKDIRFFYRSVKHMKCHEAHSHHHSSHQYSIHNHFTAKALEDILKAANFTNVYSEFAFDIENVVYDDDDEEVKMKFPVYAWIGKKVD